MESLPQAAVIWWVAQVALFYLGFLTSLYSCFSFRPRTVQSAPLPFNPQFSPFPAYYLTYPYWHAILSRVCLH
jgi:hypothetical protein